ncbi:MAG TPA: hypothetical protein VHS58_10060 [Acetobacteraceae bacterium]|nr:hypothetical protein [Acetobacteraceae bacterium]
MPAHAEPFLRKPDPQLALRVADAPPRRRGQPRDLPPVADRRRSELITPVPKARKKQGRSEQASFVMPDANDLSTAEQEYTTNSLINEIFAKYSASSR